MQQHKFDSEIRYYYNVERGKNSFPKTKIHARERGGTRADDERERERERERVRWVARWVAVSTPTTKLQDGLQ